MTMEPKYEYLRPPRTAPWLTPAAISPARAQDRETYCNRAGSCWYVADALLPGISKNTCKMMRIIKPLIHDRDDPRRHIMSETRIEPLNAWCEIAGKDLSGRCPFARVGLLTDPEGKGTDSSWSMWTPSSLHFTLWSTTFATPTRQHCQRRNQVRKRRFVQVR